MLYTNNNDIPLSLAVWLATDEYDHNPDPNTISATTLLLPIRAIVLALQNQALTKEGDISMEIPSRMGTAFHGSIEKAWFNPRLSETLKKLGYPDSVAKAIQVNPGKLQSGVIPVYLEQRNKKKIGNFTITGQYDFVGDGILEDFKSTSVYNYMFGSNNDKYRQQMSIYRWIDPNIITADHAYIRFIFTDWNAAQSRQDKKYPKSKLESKKFQLMSIQETEEFIKEIINDIELYLSKPQEDLPICTKEELWQKADVWKYYKDPAKTARSTKNFDNQADAFARYSDDGSVGMVKHIQGEVVRCKYCNVCDICTQAQGYIQSGLLT